MTRTVLVTGATGTVGQHVASALADRTGAVRVGVREPEAARSTVPATADVVAFDFAKPETWGAALADVDALFLVRPPTVSTADVTEFAEAADRVGVGHIAYLSALGAEKNVLIPHHRIEKRVVATDARHTLLRASFFMQNLLEVHRADVVEHDEIFVPAGDGKTSFVDARDLGEIAAIVLTESGHGGRAYDLTGPEALDYHEVATVFSDVLDRSITYPSPSVLEFGARMRRRGKPLGFVLLMCGIYTTARLGLAGRVTEDSRRILGRDPRGMRTFVEDYADEFRSDSGTPHQPHSNTSDAPSDTSDTRGNRTATATDDESYVETRGPPAPEVAYRVINPLVGLVLRSPLHVLVSDSLTLLTFTGAKTGNEYTTPVGYWVKDGRIVVTTHSPWWRNLKGGAEVTLHLRGESRRGVATPYPEPADVAEYMNEFIDRRGTEAARRLGLRIDGDREPTLEELEEGVTGTVVVEVELTDDGAPVREAR